MILKSRSKARTLAMQALYSWQLTNNIFDIKDFLVKNIEGIDINYFNILYIGVIKSILEIDNIIIPCLLSRNISNIDQIELAVLRIASFELKKHSYIPYKVIINEAIELIKKFGSKTSYKFINGVLDKVAYNLRYIVK